ncbi:MAG: hypothetical protein RLY71_211 [Pseudomonadota bacterium]|jgi:hypothetical protein
MAQDASSLRRRAALAALRPVLDDRALMDALWDLQDSMRGDAVSDVIGYIDRLAQRHLLDARVTKRLYEVMFGAIRNPDAANLPADPWPAMQAGRTTRQAPVAPAPVAAYAAPTRPAPMPAPVPAPIAVPTPAPALAPAPVAAPVPQGPPEQAIFSGLIRAILAEVQQFHSEALNDVRVDALKDIGRLRISGQAKHDFKQAWLKPLQDEWQVNASAAELAELTHLVYVGLCEAIGPVDADQVLARAVRHVERMAEARAFSPRRLL